MTQGLIEINETQTRLIREQFGLQEATESELAYFFSVCQQTRLNPITKQIYAIMRYDKRIGRKKLVIQIGIDGMRSIAARSLTYAGSDDATFTGTLEHNGKEVPDKAIITVWKIVGGMRVPFTASARWNEYVPVKGQDSQWFNMPHVMLAKCAEALALRKAWPEDLGQLYTEEEMQQADNQLPILLTDDQVQIIGALALVAGQPEDAWMAKARTKPAETWQHILDAAVIAASDATGMKQSEIIDAVQTMNPDELVEYIRPHQQTLIDPSSDNGAGNAE